MHTALVWFRQDLRLADNPALQAAVASGASIIPVFVWSPAEEGDWAPGAASRWWLHQSLQRLHESLVQRGSQLIIRQGPALQTLCELAASTGATAVYWNRRYEPAAVAIETQLRQSLPAAGLAAHSHQSALLCEPWSVQTGTIATLLASNRSDKRKRYMETDENCIVVIDIAYRCVYIRINMMDMYI